MRLANGSWVVVADGEKFLIFRNNGDESFLDLRVLREAEIENPPSRDQGSDRPGRRHGAAPGVRGAVADTDWHRLEKARFARTLAERLDAWAEAGRFDALVLVAEPRTLGALRPRIGPGVRARLTGELAKDLTGMPVDEIERALGAHDAA